jgi:gluconokinase
MVVIVMGVCGCGKTTVGEGLAEQLGWVFRDGDEFHPPENVAKMSKSIPLTDADREPWLGAIRSFMEAAHTRGENAVVACSALKQKYRDMLLSGEEWVRFVHVHGDPAVIRARMNIRTDHFMPPTLLESQLAILEMPRNAVFVDVALAPAEQIAMARAGLGI